jgi:hypothetical protein
MGRQAHQLIVGRETRDLSGSPPNVRDLVDDRQRFAAPQQRVAAQCNENAHRMFLAKRCNQHRLDRMHAVFRLRKNDRGI